MAATYTPIATTTLGSANNSVTFSSISGSYTDLVLIYSGTTTNNNQNLAIQFNSDTATNYSETELYGNGTTAGSGRRSSLSQIFLNEQGGSSGQTTVVTNVMNYANTTTYKTALTRYGTAGGGPETNVGLWRSTSAITAIKIFLNGGTETFTAGSTFTLYGIANADVGAYATGGIITQDANYYYHAFGNSSYFTPTRNLTADILVVAGGGGAGGGGASGGGGAGGLVALTSQSLTSGTGYSCTVGAGGAGGSGGSGGAWPKGTNGSDSQFASLTLALGGGYGGGESVANRNGGSGGSGGGGSFASSIAGSGGAGTSGQGYAGSAASGDNATYVFLGGGGGAGGAAPTATSSQRGNGGVGSSAYSSWLATTGLGVNVSGTYYIAGGGAGGSDPAPNSTGGLGGGGNGGYPAAKSGANGLANTGSGGGGGLYPATPGGSGGSGLIIVRYSK